VANFGQFEVGAHVNIYGVHHTKTVRKVGVKATHSPRRDSGLRRPLVVNSRHVSKALATAHGAVGPAAPAATKFAATVPLSHCSRPENFGMFFLYLNSSLGVGGTPSKITERRARSPWLRERYKTLLLRRYCIAFIYVRSFKKSDAHP
jgi:hypothetical protein